VLNRSWTFRAHGGPATLARYVAVQALGALFSAGGVTLASTDLSLRRLAAECLVVPLVTLMTYTLSRRIVFRGSRLA
jgi:putative flippase GtrA